MRVLYIVVALFVTGLTVTAQTNPREAKNDPEAKKVLDAVSTKFKSFSSVQAGFNYKVENSAGKALSAKTGTILMKGTRYKVSFGGQEIFCDGKTVWSYDKGANEVTINNLDASGGTITPQKLFTNFYDDDFLYVMNGEKKAGAKTIQEIEMTPTDKSKPFHKVYLQVDKSAKTIYSTRVLENGGNKYTYTVSNMKTNLPLSDNSFIFNKSKYPGVEEVDLR
jgi:outer membrane lipoprotein carrier protein